MMDEIEVYAAIQNGTMSLEDFELWVSRQRLGAFDEGYTLAELNQDA